MQTKSKIATLFVAVALSLAPVTANAYSIGASVGDNVFSWPKGWPEKNSGKQEKSKFGTIETLKLFTFGDKKKKQDKK